MGPYGLVEFGFEAVESTVFREAHSIAGLLQRLYGFGGGHSYVERQPPMHGRPTS